MKEQSVTTEKPDYGIDAPAVLRNLFLFGALCIAAGFILPRNLHIGRIILGLRPMFVGTGALLLIEAFLYLHYVRFGKLKHRDFILSLHPWRGDERVLDVGCGRGLLLAGAAKQLLTGHAVGIDLWSSEDMAANSPEATQRNLRIEGVAGRCEILSMKAQSMEFPDASFDVIVSNLCLHNIYDSAQREQALHEIARVLRPGGVALLSDYKLTREYASKLAALGFTTQRRRGSPLATFPPLTVVVARKPPEASKAER